VFEEPNFIGSRSYTVTIFAHRTPRFSRC
jgi:hypothetical protein